MPVHRAVGLLEVFFHDHVMVPSHRLLSSFLRDLGVEFFGSHRVNEGIGYRKRKAEPGMMLPLNPPSWLNMCSAGMTLLLIAFDCS